MWRANKHILRQTLDHAQVIFGHDHPPQSPSCHREIFGKGVDDIGLIGHLKRADGARLVMQPVIDFVTDQGHIPRGAGSRQFRKCGLLDHRACRVCRACQDQTCEIFGDLVGARLKATAGIGAQSRNFQTHCL